MKQVVIKAGKVWVEEVPVPTIEAGMVLVRVLRSAISSGTESSMVSGGGALSLAMKHLKNPLSVEKLKRKFATVGMKATAELVRTKLADPATPGYSSAGIIVEVGAGVPGFKVGDRVACAGVGYACHAEYNLVPHQLVTPIPDGLDYDNAAFVAIGAIAMQGVRRAEPMLGETVVVLGLGLVGQITAGLLRLNGCHVIGYDPVRGSNAPFSEMGHFTDSAEQLAAFARETTAGYGVDAVVICAGTPSSEVVNSAFDLCRQKGRVVIVGAVGMDLNREAMYRKELDLRISCSYGPGRYSSEYEEKGFDYPIGYVRWTEGRNMAEYLRLMSVQGDGGGGPFLHPLRLSPTVFPVEDAERAYTEIAEGKTFAAALRYADVGETENEDTALATLMAELRGKKYLRIAGHGSNSHPAKEVGVALIGAGAFATSVQLPILAKMPGVRIAAIATRNGVKAKFIADRYKAAACTTEYRQVLDDPSVDAVLISTRHNLHAQITLDAIAAGKHVLVEKPMALTVEDCQRICDAARQAQVLVSVGFNRRLAPLALKLTNGFPTNAPIPRTILYRCNAGPLPADHWTLDPEVGGGRILGEAVHFFDFVRHLAMSGTALDGITNSNTGRLVSVYAESGSREEELTTILRFSDGSVATVLYSVSGSPKYGKERIEVFSGGSLAVLEDFLSLEIKDGPGAGQWKSRQDKGHAALLENFIQAVQGKAALQVTAEDGLEATRIAVAALQAARTGQVQRF
jgi:predicted dehydrogenase/threonine dehydrogenase-like Zn-dependent dehydrogenase